MHSSRRTRSRPVFFDTGKRAALTALEVNRSVRPMKHASPFLALLAAAALLGCDRKPTVVMPPGPSPATQAQAEFERKLDSANPQEQLAVLNDAVSAWLMLKGTPPPNLEALVAEKMLPRLPQPPAGRRFELAGEKVVLR